MKENTQCQSLMSIHTYTHMHVHLHIHIHTSTWTCLKHTSTNIYIQRKEGKVRRSRQPPEEYSKIQKTGKKRKHGETNNGEKHILLEELTQRTENVPHRRFQERRQTVFLVFGNMEVTTDSGKEVLWNDGSEARVHCRVKGRIRRANLSEDMETKRGQSSRHFLSEQKKVQG